MDHLPVWFVASGWIVSVVLSLILGSFLPAYFKKKAENLATHEDLARLVEQMEATTQATKSIEAQISNDAWDRQKQWELKRDAVISVMQAIGEADESLQFASRAEVAQREDSAKYAGAALESWSKYYDAMKDFDQKRAVALIVCGRSINDSLMRVKRHLQSLASQIKEGTIQSYEEYQGEMGKDMALTFAYARKELGITR